LKTVSTNKGSIWRGNKETDLLFDILVKYKDALDGSQLFDDIIDAFEEIDGHINEYIEQAESYVEQIDSLQEQIEEYIEQLEDES
jgi:hypothetical protein